MSREMIDALADGDNLSAENEFKNAISQKVGAALETKRKDVASTMVSQHVPARYAGVAGMAERQPTCILAQQEDKPILCADGGLSQGEHGQHRIGRPAPMEDHA